MALANPPPRRARSARPLITAPAYGSLLVMIPATDAAPPAWFSAALSAATERAQVSAEGASIAYRAWGERGAPGIVLVHGGAAHSRWWDHIAPLLAPGRRVVALDLSGHGDSGRRETYGLDAWAREVLAVAADAGIAGPPTVIGHSMGGFVTLRLASLYGSRIAGAVAIDSPVRDLTPEEQAAREHRAFGPLHVYPTREAAIARFRPIPDQPTLGYITRHVAETSVRAGRRRLDVEVRPADLRAGRTSAPPCSPGWIAAWLCSGPSTAFCPGR